MSKITRIEALSLAKRAGINLNADYHTLNSTQVGVIVDLAKQSGYQKPKNASGSRGRYFFYNLARLSAKR